MGAFHSIDNVRADGRVHCSNLQRPRLSAVDAVWKSFHPVHHAALRGVARVAAADSRARAAEAARDAAATTWDADPSSDASAAFSLASRERGAALDALRAALEVAEVDLITARNAAR